MGAPTATVTRREGTIGVSWGAVYNCSGEGELGFQCRQLVLDDTPPVKDEVKEGQWTGVTLALDSTTADALTCAHR